MQAWAEAFARLKTLWKSSRFRPESLEVTALSVPECALSASNAFRPSAEATARFPPAAEVARSH